MGQPGAWFARPPDLSDPWRLKPELDRVTWRGNYISLRAPEATCNCYIHVQGAHYVPRFTCVKDTLSSMCACGGHLSFLGLYILYTPLQDHSENNLGEFGGMA